MVAKFDVRIIACTEVRRSVALWQYHLVAPCNLQAQKNAQKNMHARLSKYLGCNVVGNMCFLQ